MRIALGVSGGIAAYKACEIVRGLDQAGVEVQVILTANATQFITPLTLQTLSGRAVWLDPFALDQPQTIRHIELTRDLAALLIAPATANVLGKLAHGVADDLLSTLYLAVTAPVLVAPAMNTRMWLHAATQENLRRLRARGVEVIDPESGWLAEREVGWGRLAAPERIVASALAAARRSTSLAGRRVVVTAGPTREAVDPVRFLTNRSSGKMGYALAQEAASRGAEVTLISGPVDLAPPYGVRCLHVETAAQMREVVLAEAEGADLVLMAAAVADYASRSASSKIKKRAESLTLTLEPTPDILAELGARPREGVLVGFAAETDDLLEHARDKLARKNLDFIVANDVSRPEIGFDSDENAVTILGQGGYVQEVGRASKVEIAAAILDCVLRDEGPVR